MEVTLAGMHGKVHEGLMAAATYIHCNTGAALQKAAADFPGWPLLVTGHSMGGEPHQSSCAELFLTAACMSGDAHIVITPADHVLSCICAQAG